MKHFSYPDKSAKKLANQMKAFRAMTEEIAYSEINAHADSDRMEVVKQIDWANFSILISQLEFAYDRRKKHGRK